MLTNCEGSHCHYLMSCVHRQKVKGQYHYWLRSPSNKYTIASRVAVWWCINGFFWVLVFVAFICQYSIPCCQPDDRTEGCGLEIVRCHVNEVLVIVLKNVNLESCIAERKSKYKLFL
jgi:hypothetical protein